MKPLGLGMIGLHHQHPRWYYPLWSYLPEYRPVALAEKDKDFLSNENEFFNLDTHTDYRELLQRHDVDVVIIWLPHSQMPEAVAAAAAAGKHVIVEKPCAADVEGMKNIVETARKYPHIKISAPYCWRTHPVSEKIHSLSRTGVIGRIVAVEGRLNAGVAQRYILDNCPWMLKSSEGGGPMWNLGVHWVDYFRWIIGKEIVSVCGVASGPFGQPERDIEDNAQTLLTFEDGTVGILDISYSLPGSYPGKRDIYIAFRGTKGCITWTPSWQGTRDELLLVSEHESVRDNRCQRIEVISKDIPGYCGHMAWAWLKDFASAVLENHEPIVGIKDLLAAVSVVDAFYRSLLSGCRESILLKE
ncbi:Gfo/Idh/MocA family protein [Candidatus Latescibacterota bacterium]